MNSEVAVIFEGTYKIMADYINTTSVKKAVVISADDSLPFIITKFAGCVGIKEDSGSCYGLLVKI